MTHRVEAAWPGGMDYSSRCLHFAGTSALQLLSLNKIVALQEMSLTHVA